MKNASKISSLAFFSQAFRVISGPLTLIVISGNLSTEEIAFYYTFFNLLAMQQLIEIGVGFTIKQFIAHSYCKVDGSLTKDSISSIRNYFTFSLIWFFVIALTLILIGYLGGLFYSDYSGPVEWSSPWYSLVAITAFFVVFTPFQLLLEGCQRQIELNYAKIIASIVSVFALVFSIIAGMGLYSVFISALFSNVTLYLLIYKYSLNLNLELGKLVQLKFPIKSVVKELWPMLSRISVTWILGFFFWNSFNLIAFQFLNIDLAGKLAFTLALARSGYSIAESIVTSQVTLYSNMISKNESINARKMFNRSLIISMLVLFSGYLIFCILKATFPTFFLFEKTLDLFEMATIFVYFFSLIVITSQANFCRSYKIEPYFRLSLIMNVCIPTTYFFQVYYSGRVDFLLLIPANIIFLFWSYYIYKNVSRYTNAVS